MEEPSLSQSIPGMIRHVLEAGYEDYLKGEYSNYRNRLEDLQQLAHYGEGFDTPEAFLTQLALETEMEPGRGQEQTDDEERIKLSSIHQAKGLEFKIVFVIMPRASFPRAFRGIRRLRRGRAAFVYVASTRAMNELYLYYPLMRFTHHGTGDFMQNPSRFLTELPKEVYEEIRVQ